MTQALNLTMAMLLVAIGSLFALALLEPQFARLIASKLLGWAMAMERFKENRRRFTEEWEQHFHLRDSKPGIRLVREEREA